MDERGRELFEWLCKQRDDMGKLLADYDSGRRKIGRVENGRLIDETVEAISDLRQRIAQSAS